MKLQAAVLKKYLDKMGKVTIREIADDTGIQMTRVFRIMNGAEMKLSEYEIFKERLNQSAGQVERLIFECEKKLSECAFKDIQIMLERKLILSSYALV